MFYIRYNPAANSYSVFQRGRTNESGEPYCVLPLVTFDEAETFIRHNERREIKHEDFVDPAEAVTFATRL